MNGQNRSQATPPTCAECRARLPMYADGGLSKPDSLQVFLHVRECSACARDLARHEQLISELQSLPRREPPPEFDARILASIPYDAYRAMADLRGPRVPVLLAESALPAWMRSPKTRLAGVLVAAAAVVSRATGGPPEVAGVLIAVGLLPEFLVRLQAVGRRLVLGLRQAGRGV